MPVNFEELDEIYILARQVPQNPTAPQLKDISRLCDHLVRVSGRPNRRNDYRAPPPPLHLFTFIIRNHFNLQFADRAFDNESAYCDLPKFSHDGLILSSKQYTRGYSLLSELYPPQVLSYRLPAY